MTTVGIRELRQNPGRAIAQVKAGQIVIITEHGKPVAQLVGPPRSRIDELRAAGRITPATRPGWPLPPPIKLKPGEPTFSEVLAQMRADERY